ncbi:hypothetical protein [Pontiella sulfatireligans]|uniref:Uncharacterized protein n=1 Tax=Pontiella sulfatireligans TaxID=2750658 RepID=A0A6C2UG42_9BACT|nr:hypothetical protein [Pontiella sulfatireligans]VGO19135.1 hypothetical protein SCARR_01192 [Pontiella sulfatireligans]
MTASRLQRLLANIEGIPSCIDQKVDAALNGFAVKTAILTDWDSYCECLARCLSHVEATLLGINPGPVDIQFCSNRCWHLLKRKYGDSAAQAAFEEVRTGSGGGLRGVLRILALEYGAEYSRNLISVTVESYFSHRSVEQLMADAKEYMATYHQILPPEITEGTGARIHSGFRKALKQHPYLMRRLRRTSMH